MSGFDRSGDVSRESDDERNLTMDRTAIERLYDRFAPDVRRFVMFQVHERTLADDITGDVFVGALRARGPIPTDDARAKAWLFRMARNKVIDHWRRRERGRGALARLFSGGHAGTDVEAEAGTRHEMRRVIEAMRTMGDRDRMLVAMRVAGGLSFDEISLAMEMTPNAAMVATGRALKRLRAELGEP